jgi:hypothetical protein
MDSFSADHRLSAPLGGYSTLLASQIDEVSQIE